MKKNIVIVCAAIVSAIICGCGNKHQFTINGTVDGSEMDGKAVYLFHSDDLQNPVDSAVVTESHFTFKGTSEEPWQAMLANEYFTVQLIVEPGTIVIKNDSIGGTPLNDKMQAFTASLNMEDIESGMQEYIPLYYSAPNAEARAEAEHVLDSLEALGNSRILEACWSLYRENSDNLLGVMAMQNISQVGEFTYQEFDSIVNAASPCVANDKKVQKKLEQLRCIDATSAGKHYTDIQGLDNKLSDLIDGKLALVDFYASWCGPCRNEIKDNLVPLWKKYEKKGLVIVGLNVWERGDAEARKAANEKVMADLGITYPQLVDSTRTATETYGVNSIPQIMLIAPDGTILARDLRGPAIEEAIINALGK